MNILNALTVVVVCFLVGCSGSVVHNDDQAIECVLEKQSTSNQCFHHYEVINGTYSVVVTGCIPSYSDVIAKFNSEEFSCSNGKTYKTFCMILEPDTTSQTDVVYDTVCRLYDADYSEFQNLNLAENDPMEDVVSATYFQDPQNNEDYSEMKQVWIYEGFNIQL